MSWHGSVLSIGFMLLCQTLFAQAWVASPWSPLRSASQRNTACINKGGSATISRLGSKKSSFRRVLRLRMGRTDDFNSDNGMEPVRRISDLELLDDLLCQRAVQTQLTYFQEFRDGHKKQWLEEFSELPGLLTLSTFGGIVDSHAFLRDMLNAPPADHEVAVNWGNRFAGGSKDNPFIKKEPVQHTYKETVHPQKICQGIMQIREQLCEEWVDDLQILDEDDQLFWDEFVISKKGEGKSAGDESESEIVEEERWGQAKLQDTATSPGLSSKNLIMQKVRSANMASTPLRARNYDVLKKAMTFVVVNRLLAKLEASEKHVYKWFSTWFEVNGDKFQTDSGPGVSEDFLSQLLAQPMRSVSISPDTLKMIDPSQIAQEIIDKRLELSKEWIQWLAGDTVKNGHTEIIRSLLTKSIENKENMDQSRDVD